MCASQYETHPTWGRGHPRALPVKPQVGSVTSMRVAPTGADQGFPVLTVSLLVTRNLGELRTD
jgi:hypothetical protein